MGPLQKPRMQTRCVDVCWLASKLERQEQDSCGHTNEFSTLKGLSSVTLNALFVYMSVCVSCVFRSSSCSLARRLSLRHSFGFVFRTWSLVEVGQER